MLVKASQDGDLEVVLRLLYTNPFISQQELRDSLWEAVKGRRLEVLRSLLEFRVDPACEPSPSISTAPSALRHVQWTPLLALAVNGSLERAEVVAELLAAANAGPTGGSTSGGSSSSHALQSDPKKLAELPTPPKKLPDEGLSICHPPSRPQPEQASSTRKPTGSNQRAVEGPVGALVSCPSNSAREAHLARMGADALGCLQEELEAMLQAVRGHHQRCLERQLQSVQRKHDEACRGKQTLEEEHCCVICSELQKSVLFLPCRHLCTCESCSNQVQLCPICRANIVEKVTCILP